VSSDPNQDLSAASGELAGGQIEDDAVAETNSYGQILKSSALIAGASMLVIGIGIVRAKAMALLLGPAGFGLLGLYVSITGLAQNVASMGINQSGVRQIAEALGSEDTGRIARTILVLRRTSIFLGVLGAGLLIMFSTQVSTFTFGSDQYAFAIALLSVTVFFGCVSMSQQALLQGMRRISDLAKMRVLGALFGAFIGIPVVYFLHEHRAVTFLVIVAAAGLSASWWYSRKVDVLRPPTITSIEIRHEAAALLKLGFVFMASGFMVLAAVYATRVFVLRAMSIEAVGYFQAAWTLGGMYVGLLLGAMGADFYPRLTLVAKDNAICNGMVNEQTQVSLLLAGPGIIATLTFSPFVLALFYSNEFSAATELLRWICLGMSLRVAIWPMSTIIAAKGATTIFFLADLAWTLVYVGLAWALVTWVGLNGAGMAFFGAYVFQAFIIYFIARWLSGFRWSARNRLIGLIYISLIAVVFCSFYLLTSLFAYGIGTLVVILFGVYCIRTILGLAGQDRIQRSMRRVLPIFSRRVAAAEKVP